jgi:alpha-tubulin suppressor-like RCC1 family protein
MHGTGTGVSRRIRALLTGLVVCMAVFACMSCAAAGAAQISTGGGEGCTILSSGHVECWGANESGQLGNDTTTRSDAPVEVDGVSDARDVSVGESDVCAVLSTGHIVCWGSNSDGALGIGERSFYSELPVEVKGITDATQVAVGDEHACAVLSSGKVDCWGSEVLESIDFPHYAPVEVPGIENATQAVVGTWHSCALLSSAHVECWEEDFSGELGDGRTHEASKVPVEVHGVTSASQIAAGERHTCALLAGGHVACWGENDEGQLGDGGKSISSIPSEVTGLSGATQLAAGGNDTCALTSRGRMDCWGDNYYGQFDDGTIHGSDTPVEAHDLTGVTQLAVDGTFSCAVIATGSPVCWGDDEFGELGDGVNGGERDAPIAVPGLAAVTQAAIGWPHACAVITGGHLDCWGEDVFGEIGDGTTDRKQAPVEVSALSGVTQVSAGEHHSCAVLATGRVDCWGGDSWEVGQLGNGTLGGSRTPVEVEKISTATQVATSRYGSCALLSGGHVDCWGGDFGGSLGNDTNAEPSDVPVEVHDLTDAVQIAAGEEHFCAALATGHVDCWGGNVNGQLGDGSEHLSEVPAEVQGLTDATEVVAGHEHTCALQSSGHVDCWGENANGQLGNGTTIGPKLCEQSWVACSEVPIEVPGLIASKLAAGGNDSCALLSSGRVDCWGGNESGQIGDGAFGPNGCENGFCDRDEPTEVHGLAGATDIAVGGNPDFDALGSACAVVSGGALECWGSNSDGVLGDDLAWSTTPVAVGGSPVAVTPGSSGSESEPAAGPQQEPSSPPNPGAGGGVAAGQQFGENGSSPSAQARDAVLSFSASAVRGRISLTVLCHATSQCKGVASITIARPGKHHSMTKLSLGTVRFAFDGATSKRLSLRLNAYAHALLAEGKTLHATVTVVTNGSPPWRRSASLTIRPSKR